VGRRDLRERLWELGSGSGSAREKVGRRDDQILIRMDRIGLNENRLLSDGIQKFESDRRRSRFRKWKITLRDWLCLMG
jgi:hypothetical protein